MHAKDLREPQQLDDLVDPIGNVEQSYVAVVFAGLLGESDERAETGATDVVKLLTIQYDILPALLEKGVQLRFEARE